MLTSKRAEQTKAAISEWLPWQQFTKKNKKHHHRQIAKEEREFMIKFSQNLKQTNILIRPYGRENIHFMVHV